METEGLTARTRSPNVKSRQGRRLSNAQAPKPRRKRAWLKGERESTVPRLIFWASGLALGLCSPRGPSRLPLSLPPLSPSPRSEELGWGSGGGGERGGCLEGCVQTISRTTNVHPVFFLPPPRKHQEKLLKNSSCIIPANNMYVRKTKTPKESSYMHFD